MSWSRIRGHAFQKAYFKRALSLGKVHHAYLLSGPSGVGKKALALEVARALLCLQGQGEACGSCRSCLLFERSAHPDFFLLEPEKNTIGIDAVRQLIQRLSLKRVLSPFRIGVIDEVERLTEEAANCLLKTVEEPPEGVVLFLVTSRVAALPQTLLSRCQHLVFSGLPERLVAEYLVEEEHVEPAWACAVARFSSGSIGEALRSIREGNCGEEIWMFLKDVREGKLFQAGSWLSERREELPRVFSVLARYFRDALFFRLLGNHHREVLAFLPEKDRARVRELASLGPEKLRKALDLLGAFFEDIRTNVSWDVACFHFLLQLRGELL